MKKTQIWGEEKDRDKEGLVGAGGVEGRTGGAAGDGEGFKRRMTSVGRSVEGCKGWSGGNRATLGGGDQYFATTPRLHHHLPLASRCERAKLDSLPTSRARGWNRRAGERRSPWTWTGPSFNPLPPPSRKNCPPRGRKECSVVKNTQVPHCVCLNLS